MSSKFFRGSPILLDDNTIPGVKIPKELEKLIPDIFQACKDFGLDFYPTVIQMLTYDEISEIAAYGGFPVRYPHWSFGMEYEELQRGYEYGLHRIYEMVVNTNPCYIYCLNSNTLVDNVTVIAHALGHNDFFKNNIYFAPTSQNMMNKLANHGTRIRKYVSRWGKEKVTTFLDHILRLDTLIDPAKAWKQRKIKNLIITDKREVKHPMRLKVKEGHEYMQDWVNPEEWIGEQQDKIERAEIASQLGINFKSTKDILGFLKDYAPLKPWQSDIASMIYEEAMYFAPQRITKTINEGWASYVDHNIMAKMGLAGLGQDDPAGGIIEYAEHKAGVLGGKYSTNPYKLGYCLLQDIEDRWNKGKFGKEYDECKDMREKEKWNKNLGLGKEKVFEVKNIYNDYNLISEFFTPEFCRKYEFFKWKRFSNGDVKVDETEDFDSIKKELLTKYANGGLPEIHLVDTNHKGKGYLLLEHQYTGLPLYEKYVLPVMQSIYYIWNRDVILTTQGEDNEELVYYCDGIGDEDVALMTREEYEE